MAKKKSTIQKPTKKQPIVKKTRKKKYNTPEEKEKQKQIQKDKKAAYYRKNKKKWVTWDKKHRKDIKLGKVIPKKRAKTIANEKKENQRAYQRDWLANKKEQQRLDAIEEFNKNFVKMYGKKR